MSQETSSVFTYFSGISNGILNAGFDLDDTLIYKSGSKLRVGVKEKLKYLVSLGYNIIVISNQVRRHIGDEKLLTKLKKFSEEIDVPIKIYCARERDEYRKPEIGIISLLLNQKLEFFVGDAAGRQGDHDDCDLVFAKNAKIPFYLPEDYFFMKQEENKIDLKLPKELSIIVNKNQCLVILVGYPGSGKSTFSKNELINFEYVSRDVLKTISKCKQQTMKYLQEGKNIVIDNTNGTQNQRKELIELIGTNSNIKIICIHVATSFEESRDRNSNREKKVPIIALYMYRKNFEEPKIEEGFDYIFKI